MRGMRFLLTIGVAGVLVVTIYTGVHVSPRLAAMLHRHPVLDGVTARFDERYDTKEPDALLDVFYPSQLENAARLPTIVWVHGGAFSGGSKDDITRYLEILAAKNFTVVGVNYSLAPARHYPTPILQANTALAFLIRNEARLHVDAREGFFGGRLCWCSNRRTASDRH
jgi:acetyl esterase